MSSTIARLQYWHEDNVCLHVSGILCLIWIKFKKLQFILYFSLIWSWSRKLPHSPSKSLIYIIPCDNQFCHTNGLLSMVIYWLFHSTCFFIICASGVLIVFNSNQAVDISAQIESDISSFCFRLHWNINFKLSVLRKKAAAALQLLHVSLARRLTQAACSDYIFISKSISFSPPDSIGWVNVSLEILAGLPSHRKSEIIFLTSQIPVVVRERYWQYTIKGMKQGCLWPLFYLLNSSVYISNLSANFPCS